MKENGQVEENAFIVPETSLCLPLRKVFVEDFENKQASLVFLGTCEVGLIVKKIIQKKFI